MLKKFSISFVIIIFIAGVSLCFVKKLSYVPFVHPLSNIHQLTDSDDWVTLPEYAKDLSFTNAKVISSLDQLTHNQIVLLPWDAATPKLRHLPIHNKMFYESPKGTIQVKRFRRKGDGYVDFLNQHIQLTAGGTVVLARGVQRVIDRRNDVLFPWRGTRHLFQRSDINIVNFKSPLVYEFSQPKSRWRLVGKSDYVQGLVAANINLVSISGNHMGDAGPEGLLETIDTLHQHHIATVGAGNKTSAYRCLKFNRNGTMFGFLAFNNVGGSIGKAEDNRIGIAWLDQDALDAVANCDEHVDQLIVMVNWGIEYVHKPRQKEVEWANALVDHGADIVIGDQAHWVQNHEQIGSSYVSYGLGNYIFDQHWSENTTEGIIQRYIFNNKSLLTVDVIPVKLQKKGGVEVVEPGSERYMAILSAYYGAVEK